MWTLWAGSSFFTWSFLGHSLRAIGMVLNLCRTFFLWNAYNFYYIWAGSLVRDFVLLYSLLFRRAVWMKCNFVPPLWQNFARYSRKQTQDDMSITDPLRRLCKKKIRLKGGVGSSLVFVRNPYFPSKQFRSGGSDRQKDRQTERQKMIRGGGGGGYQNSRVNLCCELA